MHSAAPNNDFEGQDDDTDANAIADEKLPLNLIKNIANAQIKHASQYPCQITSNEEFETMVKLRMQVNEVPESHQPATILDISRISMQNPADLDPAKSLSLKRKSDIDKNFVS